MFQALIGNFPNFVISRAIIQKIFQKSIFQKSFDDTSMNKTIRFRTVFHFYNSLKTSENQAV